MRFREFHKLQRLQRHPTTTWELMEPSRTFVAKIKTGLKQWKAMSETDTQSDPILSGIKLEMIVHCHYRVAGRKLCPNGLNLPICNPKQDFHNINAHIKFGVIHWSLLKLSSRNGNLDVLRVEKKILSELTDKSKTDLFNINAHTKFGEHPFLFTQGIIQNENRRTDTRMSNVKP